VAYPAWTGVRDAKTQSPNCPQKDVMQTGGDNIIKNLVYIFTYHYIENHANSCNFRILQF